jgi:predicted MFS family arabinose efflux permease
VGIYAPAVNSTRGPLVAFAALGVLWGGWAALLPAVQAAVGASEGELGLALLGVGAGALPAMLLAGRLIDLGRRGVLPGAFAALAASALLPGLAGSVATLGAALVVLGACSGAADVAMNSEVAALEAAGGRRLMQLAHALYSLSLAAGAVASGLLLEAGAGRLTVLAVLAAALLAAAAATRGTAARVAVPSNRLLLGTKPSRPLALLGIACAAAFVVEGGLEAWSALYLQRDLGAGAATGAAGPAAFGIAMAAGRGLAHRLTGRLRDRRLLAGGGALAAAGLLLASAAGSVALAAGAFFVAGFGVSVAAPILFGAAGRTGSAGAVATVTTIGYLGFVVGPPIVGGIAQLSGLAGSFAVLAGIAVLLALAAPRLALETPPAAAPVAK